MKWRFVITRTGGKVTALDVDGIAAFRAQVAAARADPEVLKYKYWVAAEVPKQCAAGHPVVPAQASVQDCRCGLTHLRTRCFVTGCTAQDWTPPYGEGCGEIPLDPEGAEQRTWRPHR